jgi:hypothetical protein
MPKRKEPELDPKEQFKRFQEAAKEHVEDEQSLDKAFKKLRTTKSSSKTSGHQGR